MLPVARGLNEPFAAGFLRGEANQRTLVYFSM